MTRTIENWSGIVAEKDVSALAEFILHDLIGYRDRNLNKQSDTETLANALNAYALAETTTLRERLARAEAERAGLLTADQVRTLLRVEVEKAGSPREWVARHPDIAHVEVWQLLERDGGEPDALVADALGLERVVSYRALATPAPRADDAS